jgi:hypothetical protein
VATESANYMQGGKAWNLIAAEMVVCLHNFGVEWVGDVVEAGGAGMTRESNHDGDTADVSILIYPDAFNTWRDCWGVKLRVREFVDAVFEHEGDNVMW